MVIEDKGTGLISKEYYAYKMYKPGYLCTLLQEGIVVKSKSDPKKEEKLDHNEMSKHVPATA